jgi:hypothetical protein
MGRGGNIAAMSHTYKVIVTHNGEDVQVYPQQTGRGQLDPGGKFDEACQRIGMMVMSSGITSIKVYRDDKLHRTAEVTAHSDLTEK